MDYVLISARSSGWVSGEDVYLWYYILLPSGKRTATDPLGSCRPSGGTCNASTTWYASSYYTHGTFSAEVYGVGDKAGTGTAVQSSNTSSSNFSFY